MSTTPKYDPKTKRISLFYDFSPYCQARDLKFSGLKIKLIASREAWLWALVGSKRPLKKSLPFDTLSFADVKPFFSRNPRKTVESLGELAEEDQDHFSAVFFDCVMQANCVNPLFRPARKKRGGSPYDLNIEGVKMAARQLYTHLRLLKIHKPRGWGDKLAFLENKYGVIRGDLRPAVMEIIQQEFNFKLDTRPDSEGTRPPDPCHFYRKFIHSPNALAWMKNSNRIKTGATPFLIEVFS